ncbi:hypothetical protein ACXN5S_09425 [Pseudoroseicyclus sp. H15]
MSNPDSFIDEVSEALRRDQLGQAFRRWWWIGAVVVLVIVGGAAFVEFRGARERAEAQAVGAALLNAMDSAEPGARVAALETAAVDGPANAVVQMLTAAEEMAADDPEAAAERLEALAAMPDLPAPYGSLAALKAVMLRIGTLPEHEIRTRLEGLAAPGAPFRLLADEQIALSELRDDQREDAVARLERIGDDAEVTSAQKNRIDALLTALGAATPAPAAASETPDASAEAVSEALAEPADEAVLEELPPPDAVAVPVEDAAIPLEAEESAPADAAPAEDAAAPVADEELAPAEDPATADEPAPAEEPAPSEEPSPAEDAAPAEAPAPAEEAPADDAAASEAPADDVIVLEPAPEDVTVEDAPATDGPDAAPAADEVE